MSSHDIVVSSIRYVPAGPEDQQRGLLGWVSCALGLIRVDGIAVRRTLSGRLALSFPRGRGRHPVVRPLNDEARLAIEEAVLASIGWGGDGSEPAGSGASSDGDPSVRGEQPS